MFMKLAEEAGEIVFLDMEATGLNPDYNSCIVITAKPWNREPISWAIKQPGNDRAIVREASEYLNQRACWVTYYGKGFDKPFIQGRLLKWGLPKLEKVHHLDLYFHLKYHVNPARKSQAHYLEWLGLKNTKMTLSPDEWNEVLRNPKTAVPVLQSRCERDCAGLEDLYNRSKHLIGDITR